MSLTNVIRFFILSPSQKQENNWAGLIYGPNPERIRLCVMEIAENGLTVGWIVVNPSGMNYAPMGAIKHPNGEFHIPAFSRQIYFPTKEKLREYVGSLQRLFCLDVVQKEKEQEWRESFDISEWCYEL